MTPDNGSADLIVRCAGMLAAAESARIPIDPLTAAYPQLSVADAYRIQQENIELRVARGEQIVGHKIGLTAKAMQDLFGVNEPDFGHLMNTMMHEARIPLDLGELIDPQIEVEPAFVLGRRLQGPGVSVADVLAATTGVRVCLEVIDSRIIDWRIKLQDTVADNGSSARVVLGSQIMPPSMLKLDDLDTELELDGVVVETGNTSAILGNPAKSIAWLANRLADFGIALEPGHFVLPGTCTRSVRIRGRRWIVGRIAGLGEVLLHLTGKPAIAAMA
ncbi:MAG: fumarylacetoacetate hydrolase family protein [Steroidobacteraceae bacterium]